MNFVSNLSKASPIRSFFLGILLISNVNNPKYQWPVDYLTAEPYCKGSACEPNACSASETNSLPIFDYIIVGSGPAGSTIAYRLVNEFPDRKVLLIEAGAEPLIDSIAPKLWLFSLNSSVVFDYFAELSPNFAKAFQNGAQCKCGKQIGGSTGINGMMYVCGTDKDYNDWATSVGDPSWNYQEMLQLIKKNQNMKDPKLLSGTCAAFHGTTGPLPIISSSFDLNEDRIFRILQNIAIEKNQRRLLEINCGAPYTGLVHIQSTVDGGERSSAATAFIVPIRNNSNFYYMRESLVEKVNLKNENGNLYVTGVDVLTKRRSCPRINLKAKREIVISAGAYNSPQILLRSGIGRQSDLQQCNIPQFNDLPVGHNLADHLMTIHFFTIPGSFMTSSNWRASLYFSIEATRYSTLKTGFFSTSGFNHNWFINTLNSSSQYPDIQLAFVLLKQNTVDLDVIFRENLGFKEEFVRQLINANRRSALIMVSNVLLQPKSLGTVKLRDCNNPFEAPIIDANYLSDQSDLDTILRAINVLNNYMTSNTARNARIAQLNLAIPECDVHIRNSQEYNLCYVRYFSKSIWHPTGTCRMGSSSANNVVDSKLKVFGVKNSAQYPMLRVADASIMPTISSGNTQCPVYAIGEKAAKTIIEDNF